MKLSISLPVEDVAVLDQYAQESGLRTRSAVVRHAIGMLRHPNLEEEYTAAWQEWEASDERSAWEATTADGVADAAR